MAKKRRRISAAIVTVLVLAMTVSAVGLWHRSATASTVDSIIQLTNQDIDKNLSQYLNSSVIYKLPETVKDTDPSTTTFPSDNNASTPTTVGGDDTPVGGDVTTGADAPSDLSVIGIEGILLIVAGVLVVVAVVVYFVIYKKKK